KENKNGKPANKIGNSAPFTSGVQWSRFQIRYETDSGPSRPFVFAAAKWTCVQLLLRGTIALTTEVEASRNKTVGTQNGCLVAAFKPTWCTQESAAVPPEPFDNSTYKNYQHHSYTSFTFADLDVEMAKYRLPQPSSGRPSPRH
uniref:Uncharacterized protein n=1 Tax=Poecilia mexicana TaxID=48701 RepID=A0A3B3YVV4_9TELE